MNSFLPFLEWHHTAEGETFLQQLYNVKTSGRKLFGVLEKPYQSKNVEEVCYKLFFIGKNGIGKTFSINKIAGNTSGSHHFETVGIRITDVFWPIKVWHKIILFKLQCWEAGYNSMKKYNHIQTSCVDKADLLVFVFSYNDGSSFLELPLLINKYVSSNENPPGFTVVGVRNLLKCEVTKSEIKDFELKYSVQILTIQNMAFPGVNEAIKIAPFLNTVCEHLWLRDQQYILKQCVKV